MFIVWQQDPFLGKMITECETEEEVYTQLRKGYLGQLYSVSTDDPNNEDISQFVPF
jgi:hypothetical protein